MAIATDVPVEVARILEMVARARTEGVVLAHVGRDRRRTPAVRIWFVRNLGHVDDATKRFGLFPRFPRLPSRDVLLVLLLPLPVLFVVAPIALVRVGERSGVR